MAIGFILFVFRNNTKTQQNRTISSYFLKYFTRTIISFLIFTNYFADTAQHMNDDELVTVTVANNDGSNGKLVVKGPAVKIDSGYKVKKNSLMAARLQILKFLM